MKDTAEAAMKGDLRDVKPSAPQYKPPEYLRKMIIFNWSYAIGKENKDGVVENPTLLPDLDNLAINVKIWMLGHDSEDPRPFV